MADYAVIFISACLVNNLILDYLLGVSPAVAVSRKIETAAGMGAAIVFTLTIAALVSYPVRYFLLVPFDIEYLERPGREGRDRETGTGHDGRQGTGCDREHS